MTFPAYKTRAAGSKRKLIWIAPAAATAAVLSAAGDESAVQQPRLIDIHLLAAHFLRLKKGFFRRGNSGADRQTWRG
ncbi:hypothetical protein D8B20_11610 [Candidatus Pantoea soli]|uniref:Uncharacterized protein n=1 Tax=Candidatus Pantoea soli TaxID=3098669 RepID=A0A518XE70_9GAMM|nr:hypothetical protein D8B20_11610 [Pantoea soli]